MSYPNPKPASLRHAGLTAIIAASAIGAADATTYYVDPATGSMSNPGTAASPWSTLAAVFSANKVFAAGDEILLRSGYHGSAVVKGHNSGYVTIRPENASAVPTLSKLIFRTGSYWVVSGVDISPEHASPVVYGGNLTNLESTAHHVTLRDSRLRSSAQDPHTWAVADWDAKASKGIDVAGTDNSIIGNDIDITTFSIVVNKAATGTLVSRNNINHFSMDAIRALSNNSTYEYNYITNSYISDDNHDDFFQSWSTNSSGTVGAGTVSNVTVRGNFFISNTDSAQPLQKAPQGIGCFDGMFENWVIENNVISSKTYHGIALYGAINCRIVNNIAVENAVNGSSTIKPWVKIYEHKDQGDGSPWPVASSGNLIRNNISSATANMPSTAGVRDHNLTTTAYPTYFANYTGFDFYPVATSPAIDAGDSTNAPATDNLGNPRVGPYDVGAYEYQSEIIVDNSSAADFTTVGSWTASTSNAGYYGGNYVHDENTDKGAKTATFTAAPGTGSYSVYLRWTSGTNRASNVPVTVNHAGGASTVTVDQRTNGGAWRLLGTYNFQTYGDASVVLSNTGTNGFVIADAVRFVKQ